ncbi:hypothetical protein FRC11_003187 [Ceratobasidium sp. 423]|nr:hypothetical protein FRC11_003187 [Ceratobasidium sp. 423]
MTSTSRSSSSRRPSMAFEKRAASVALQSVFPASPVNLQHSQGLKRKAPDGSIASQSGQKWHPGEWACIITSIVGPDAPPDWANEAMGTPRLSRSAEGVKVPVLWKTIAETLGRYYSAIIGQWWFLVDVYTGILVLETCFKECGGTGGLTLAELVGRAQNQTGCKKGIWAIDSEMLGLFGYGSTDGWFAMMDRRLNGNKAIFELKPNPKPAVVISATNLATTYPSDVPTAPAATAGPVSPAAPATLAASVAPSCASSQRITRGRTSARKMTRNRNTHSESRASRMSVLSPALRVPPPPSQYSNTESGVIDSDLVDQSMDGVGSLLSIPAYSPALAELARDSAYVAKSQASFIASKKVFIREDILGHRIGMMERLVAMEVQMTSTRIQAANLILRNPSSAASSIEKANAVLDSLLEGPDSHSRRDKYFNEILEELYTKIFEQEVAECAVTGDTAGTTTG